MGQSGSDTPFGGFKGQHPLISEWGAVPPRHSGQSYESGPELEGQLLPGVPVIRGVTSRTEWVPWNRPPSGSPPSFGGFTHKNKGESVIPHARAIMVPSVVL